MRICQALYKDQRFKVERRELHTGRGTKQGDLMSPTPFHPVLRRVFSKLTINWAERGGGIRVSTTQTLTNLGFADGIFISAFSRKMLEGMLGDLARQAAEVGLQLHFGKIQALCNRLATESE